MHRPSHKVGELFGRDILEHLPGQGQRPHDRANGTRQANSVAKWACACLGIVSKGPESAQGMGLVIFFPLAIVSNAMVPTQGMPGWLQTIANWNPVSAVTAAARTLFGNPNPSATLHVWAMQHPIIAALAWSAAILLVFVPLATHLYRRRTTG